MKKKLYQRGSCKQADGGNARKKVGAMPVASSPLRAAAPSIVARGGPSIVARGDPSIVARGDIARGPRVRSLVRRRPRRGDGHTLRWRRPANKNFHPRAIFEQAISKMKITYQNQRKLCGSTDRCARPRQSIDRCARAPTLARGDIARGRRGGHGGMAQRARRARGARGARTVGCEPRRTCDRRFAYAAMR